jgi:probable F420-dependent oxidoreductase
MSLPNSLAATTPAFSIQPPNFTAEDPGVGGWRPFLDRCRAADAAGVDRIVVSDHVVFGEELEAYADPKVGGTRGGKQPTGPDGHWLEPLTTLSVIAGMTKNTRLMTGILIAALRRPTVLAKSLATLDVLSEGRLDLGVGVGWQAAEYEACGLAFEGRGKLLDHTLDVCQTLWREQTANHSSDLLRFDKIHQMPEPLQPGGVPLWISGTLNKNVIARIVRFGSGWIPWGPDAMNPIDGLAKIREALAAAGRDAKGFQVGSYLQLAKNSDGSVDVEKTMAPVQAMMEGGITDFRATLPLPSELAACTDFLSPIVEGFRKAAGR